MSKLPTIAFDIDGVFADFTHNFTHGINAYFDTRIGDEWPSFTPYELGYMTREHWDKGWEIALGTPFFWATLPAYEQDKLTMHVIEEILSTMSALGYFISRRADCNAPGVGIAGNDARVQTRIWLENNGISSAQGVLVGTKMSRLTMLEQLGADAYIDDYGEQALDLFQKGVNVFLLNRSWNQHVNFPAHRRVNSVMEFLEKAVKPLLSPEAQEQFFSKPKLVDLCGSRNADLSTDGIRNILTGTAAKFSDLPERTPNAPILQ